MRIGNNYTGARWAFSQRPRKRRSPGSGLGQTQKLVLNLLAAGDKSIRDLAYDWPTLTEAAARSAVNSLSDRSLVDLAGFDGRARTFCLTDKGREVERALIDESE